MSKGCNILSIPNPFIGKPAYVTASEPCPKVCKPCELQEPPDDPDESDEPDQPMTPGCVAVVYASNPATPLLQFSFDEESEEYTALDGSTIHYDQALGYVVNIASGGSFLANPASLNPVNSYASANGDVLTTVRCESVSPPIPEVPDCVKTVYADDATVTLGDWSADGTSSYDPADPDQGSLTYVLGAGWRLIVEDVVYSGSEDQNQPVGLYFATDGKAILIRSCSD